jgi:hypothetical protein
MKNTGISLFYFFFILIFFSECSVNQSTGKAIELFDLKPIVENDIALNQKNHTKQKKIITINHQREMVTVDNADWKTDLQILIDADINKKDWEDKFTLHQNSTETTSYISINNKVPIKELTITGNENNNIEEIYIEKVIKSGLFSNNQTITYKPSTYLKVKSIQKALFMKDFVSEVEIYFESPQPQRGVFIDKNVN